MKFLVTTKLYLACIFSICVFVTSSVSAQEFENLGANINTKEYQECAPFISPDGKTLFFSRKYNPESAGSDDIYYSTLDASGNWTKAIPLTGFNNKNRNVVYDISPDGNQLVLLGKYGSSPTENGLSIATKTVDGWSEPVPFVFERESEISWGNNACTFSSNRNVMIVSLKGDLHVSFKNKNGVWSFPAVFKGGITTTSNEYTPFLSSDDKTLYFSGGGHGGLGGNDIFKVTRLDDTWLNWSTPENLGAPINSSDWESFFRVSAKGDYAYVYSLKTNNGDIFRIKLAETAKPEPVLLVRGKVLNGKTKEPLGAMIVYRELITGKEIGVAYTNPTTGEYQIILPKGKTYSFSAEKESFFGVNDNLDAVNITEYTELTRDLLLTPIEIGVSVRLNNIFFNTNESTLKDESYPELDRIVQFLNDNKSIEIEITGHTDNVGSDEYNLKLSRERTKSVYDYLVSKGITATRLKYKGYGKTRPVDTNDTEEGRANNRRVEFEITKK
ncbi:MAG TPA: OmpA family protein [Crocinitomicaceae bacterium]|nr:OmpA family protein [Crocinitomicaceae bacterium]